MDTTKPVNSFYINNALVDADRRMVMISGETVSLEPKVFKVLHYLASHPGQVISHQDLLDAIWTNTVVEPGALQRCIARLRKVFGDDARKQQVIATYPKRGYSLVADVSWRPMAEATTESWWTPLKGMATAAVIVVLLGVVSIYSPGYSTGEAGNESPLANSPSSLLDNPALLTAIANPDDFPVYSPDGRYVVYPRYLEEGKAHLWARDLAYGNDFLLTDEAGQFEHLSWSRDSSQLIFVDADEACSSLKKVAVSQSETNTLMVEKLIECSTSRLLAPEWINNNALAYIAIRENAASLVQFDLKMLTSEQLLESNDKIPYHLSFSRQTNILTIMAIDPLGQKELLFLDINSGNINRNDTAVFTNEDSFYPSSTPR